MSGATVGGPWVVLMRSLVLSSVIAVSSFGLPFDAANAAGAVTATATGTASASGGRCEAVFAARARIAIQNDNIASNNFNISRNLKAYSAHFPFQRSMFSLVSELPAGSVWVDMGAGKAIALMNGLQLNPGLKGVAIGFKRPFDSMVEEQAPGRFEYLDGEYVENMAADGRLDHLRGRVQFLTDVFGPLSYSENLPKLLQVYVDLLAKGGTADLNIMSERNYDGTHYEPSRRTYAVNAVDGDAHGFIAWLREIPGLDVVETAPFRLAGNAIWERSDAVRIVKTADDVVVPPTLITTHYAASSPPTRTFMRTDRASSAKKNAKPFRLRAFFSRIQTVDQSTKYK